MINHPYPIGTMCIVISSKDESLIGRYCEVFKSLGHHSIFREGIEYNDFGYGVLIDEFAYFTKKENILAIEPDDDFKEEEKYFESIMEEVDDEQCVIVR